MSVARSIVSTILLVAQSDLLAMPAMAASKVDDLVGHVWIEEKPQSDLPGVSLVFLSDGTLILNSCWETYALRKWTRMSPDTVVWDEDGAKTIAKITSVSEAGLTLNLGRTANLAEHKYTLAKIPYVCPEMRR